MIGLIIVGLFLLGVAVYLFLTRIKVTPPEAKVSAEKISFSEYIKSALTPTEVAPVELSITDEGGAVRREMPFRPVIERSVLAERFSASMEVDKSVPEMNVPRLDNADMPEDTTISDMPVIPRKWEKIPYLR